MVSGIPIDLQRQRMIRDHVKRQDSDGGLAHGKLVVKGQVKQEPIYRIPLEDLLFNKSNGRIRAEVLDREAQLGRELGYDTEDQKAIAEMLLSGRPEENEKVSRDLQANGQLMPGIITCDGIVINGNRRKALLERIYEDTNQRSFSFLEVHVLPSALTRVDLWQIEAGIQLSSPQQLDYSPINNLLKLREGRDSGLTADQIAGGIFGMTKENVDKAVSLLDLIDEYLDEFLDSSGKYHLVRDRNEHFINLQNMLSWTKTPRGPIRRDWVPDESDIAEFKLVAFNYIRMRMPHLRIRDLRSMFATKDSWEQLKRIYADEAGEEVDADVVDSADDPPTEDEDLGAEDDEEEDAPDGYLPSDTMNADLGLETRWIGRNRGRLKAIFEDAKEQEQLTKDAGKPLTLAKRALKSLQAIRDDADGLADSAVDDVLRDVVQRVNLLRKVGQRAAGQ